VEKIKGRRGGKVKWKERGKLGEKGKMSRLAEREEVSEGV